MNLFKFYRLDFCLRNLGLGIIAIFSLDFIPEFHKATLAILQILLVQMHSFSMNNYFDAIIWSEKNYTYELISNGVNKKKLFFLIFLPLLFLVLTIPFSNIYFFILFFYIILFALYQFPITRKKFKNHYFPSIIINSICLGTILYLYPYLFLSGKLTLTAIIFSVIFFFYLGFHEIVHQIAHLGKDKIYSLSDAIGIKKTVKVIECFLLIAIIIAIYPLFINLFKYFFFTGTILFSALRIFRLERLSPEQNKFKDLKNRKDKFYSFQEGLYYLIFLILTKFIV